MRLIPALHAFSQCYRNIGQTTGRMQHMSVPIYQVISQSHTSQKISDMVRTWKNTQFRQKVQNEMIMDESDALLLSSVETSTSSHSVQEYLSHCFDGSVNKKSRPSCYIRIDRSHAVATIVRNKQFERGVNKRSFAVEFSDF